MCLNQLYALWCHTSHKYIFINIFPILSFSYGPPRPTASGLVKKKIGACIIFIWPTAPHCLLPAGKKQGHVFYSIICPLVPYLTHIYILKLFPIPSFSYGPQRPTASGLVKKKTRGMYHFHMAHSAPLPLTC